MFAKNLRYLRKKRGMNQGDVANQLGVVIGTVSQWEVGRSIPNMAMIIKLSELFGVDVQELLSDDLEENRSKKTGQTLEQRGDYVSIPVYSFIHAGLPSEMIEDNIIDWEDIPKRMTRGDKQFFGLVVKGNSMYPRYEDGDTIIVQSTETFDSGDDCIVRINGDEAVLRKVIKENGNVTLVPVNIQEYSPKTFTGDESEPSLSVIGVVVELRRKMK